MAKLKVRWTESAITEFGKMLTYYNVRNGNSKYSRSIVKMVRESLKLVAKFPLMYRSVDTKEIRDVRVFHCDYFLIYYRILETEILVEGVFDTRQDPATLPY
ncbi:MAG: type II toxin-antitoxin system RelE/ParE family toxin [Bacteroidaceae bacterium]|nr:type II toxin-antitoxin system RelE/ParE family toxin [Bacteroidaceae bacterium]